MHALLREAWLPIFKMHDSVPVPSWDDFVAHFGAHIPAPTPCDIGPINASKLEGILKRMKASSAPGADGWRVAELRMLPMQFLDKLADLLNEIEDTGIWPQPFTEGLISLIPKGEGTAPSKLRPFGLMAVVYRLWSAVRVRDIVAWQESWADDSLHG